MPGKNTRAPAPGRRAPARKEYDNTNKFSLFPNDKMRVGHKDPDLSGYINIDGVDYWLKAWIYYNEGDDTIKVLSGLIGDERVPQEKEEAAADHKSRRR
jgi:hypothetical protein